MGVQVPNKEMLVDYTQGQTFFRIHLDIPLTNEQASEIRNLLEKNEWNEARRLLKGLTEKSTHRLLDAL